MLPSKDEYQRPEFDPWTLKMDQIRDLLVEHKVKPPTGVVRKQTLVDLFNQHVRLPTTTTAAAGSTTAKAARSSADSHTTKSRDGQIESKAAIEVPTRAFATDGSAKKKASSSKPTKATTAANESPMAAPSSTPIATLRRSGSVTSSSSRTPSPTKASSSKAAKESEQKRSKTASSKKAVAAQTEEDEEEIPKPKPIPSRRTKAATSTHDDTGSDTPARGRKLKKTSSVSETEDTDVSTSTEQPRRIPRTNFSKENPFQSASESERSRSRSRTRIKKKTTKGATSSASRRSPKSRHGGEDTDEDEAAATRESVFKVPPTPQFARFMQVPKRGRDMGTNSSHGVSTSVSSRPATTIVAPEAAALNVRRISSTGLLVPKELDLTRTRTSLTMDEEEDHEAAEWARSKRTALKGMCVMLLFMYLFWYRQQRFEIGYCTQESATDPTETSALGFLVPTCIPCPDHAICLTAHSEPMCAPKYLLRPHLLSFGGFLPLTPRCVLNKAQEYRSLQVADAAELLLHQRAGKVECDLYYRPVKEAELRGKQRMSVSDLKNEILKQKEDSVTYDEFDEYWTLALRELRGRKDNVDFGTDVNGEHVRSLKPRKSLVCQARQALVSWIVKFKVFLSILVISGLGILYIYHRIQQRSKERRIIQGLVQHVLIKLADQAYYHYVDPIQYPDTAISVNQLRDALVHMDQTTFSHERRNEIWDKVKTIIESNSNVLTGAREFRGDPYQVWEWVGPTGVLSSSMKNDLQGEQQQHHLQQHHAYTQASSADPFGPDISGSSGLGSAGGRGRRTSGGAGTHADLMYGTGSSVTGYRGVPKAPPQLGPQGSFFGMRRQDSEFLNPGNSLYPTLSQEEYGTFQE